MIRLPFVSRALYDDIYDRYLANIDAASAADQRHRSEMAEERRRYERLVDKLTAKPAAEVFTAPEILPLPSSILEALDAMSLYGAVRGANEAMARRLLGSGMDAREVVARLKSGVMFDGTADEYVPDAAFPEDDEDV